MDAADVAQQIESAFLGDKLAEQRRRAALDAPGADLCADCAEPIPAARRRALPSAFRCVNCQAYAERIGRVLSIKA